MAVRAAKLMVEVGADTSAADRALDSTDAKLRNIGSSAGITGGMLTAGLTLPLVGVGTTALQTAISYQSAMAMFQASSGATAAQMALVGARAKDLGADMTLPATSAGDAAAAMTELVRAGLSVDAALAAAKGTLQLDAAGQLDNADAAKINAAALNAFKLPGEEATRVANLLAAGSNASAAEVRDLADGMKMAAAVFATSNQSVETLVTGLGLMANAGIAGSDAGTSLKQMMLSLVAPTDKAAGIMADLGINVYDAQGAMLPMRSIVEQFSTKMAGLTEQQRNAALATIFGSDAVRAANIVLMGGVEAWDRMEQAVTKEGAAADLAGARMAGLGGALAGLGSQVETVMLQVAEPFLGMLEGWVQKAAEFVPVLGQLDPALVNAGIAFATVLAAAGPAVLIFGALAGAVAFLLSPLGLVVAALALFAAAYASNFMGIADITNAVVGAIAGYISGLVTLVTQLLAGDWAGAWETAKGAAQTAWENITAAVSAAWPVIQGLVNAGVEAVTGFLAGAWEGIKGTAEAVWGAIAQFFSDWWGTILFGIVTGGLGPLALFIAANWDSIKTGAETAWNAISDTVTGWAQALWDGVVGIIEALPGWLDDRWGEISAAANTAWEGFWQTVTDWATKTKDDIIAAVQAALDFVLAGPPAWMDAGKKLITALADGIRAIQIPLPKFDFTTVDGPLGTKIPKLDIGVDWKSIGDLIPALAHGGDILRAGLALVGERGPELLQLPAGARVAPLPSGGSAGGGTVVNVTVNVEGSVTAERDLVQAVYAGLLQIGQRNGSVGLA